MADEAVATIDTIVRSLPRLMQQPGGIESFSVSSGSMRGDYLVRTDECQQRAADQKRIEEEEKARKVEEVQDGEEAARLEREQQYQAEKVRREEQEEWEDLESQQHEQEEVKQARLRSLQEQEEDVAKWEIRHARQKVLQAAMKNRATRQRRKENRLHRLYLIELGQTDPKETLEGEDQAGHEKDEHGRDEMQALDAKGRGQEKEK